MAERRPLGSLAATPVPPPLVSPIYTSAPTYGWGAFVLWFIIIAVIVWFILYSLRPTWVQQRDNSGQPTGAVDAGKVLLASIVIALIIIIIVWLIRGTCTRY